MMATIEDLPSELLLMIFSHYIRNEGHEKFLRNIPRVCKHWNRLSSKASLWKDVTLRDKNYLLNFSRRGLLYNTQSLKFCYYDDNFHHTNLSTVLKNIRDLKALYLPMYIPVSSDTIKSVSENCPHLERLRLKIGKSTTPRELGQFLTACGPTLKHLNLSYWCSREAGQQLVSGIAAKCPLLETFVFIPSDVVTPFPIHELRSGCPRIRELEFCRCQLINTEKNDSSLGCGFKELRKFKAVNNDFGGVDISFLLKDSTDFEHLELHHNRSLVFCNILKIPCNKLMVLDIKLKDPYQNLKALEYAVYKWRRTLSVLNLWDRKCDSSSVLENFLQDNPNPLLKSLSIGKNIDLHLLQRLIQQCQNLNRLVIENEIYIGRKGMLRSFGIPCKRKRKLCLRT